MGGAPTTAIETLLSRHGALRWSQDPYRRHPAGSTLSAAAEDLRSLHQADDSLALKARDGERGAFEQLVRRHHRAALAVAERFLGDHSAAEDVVQEAFIKVYRALPGFEARGRFRAFLLTVVRNECKMVRRSAAATRRMHDRYAAVDEENAPTADAEVMAAEWRRQVGAALASLKDPLLQTVKLRFDADLSQEEIAKALGIPVGTVKSRLSSGVAKLRRKLRGQPPCQR